jgi:hypothetical protein
MTKYEDPRPPLTAPLNPPLFVSLVCGSHGQPAVIRFRFDGRAHEAVGASKQRRGSVPPFAPDPAAPDGATSGAYAGTGAVGAVA